MIPVGPTFLMFKKGYDTACVQPNNVTSGLLKSSRFATSVLRRGNQARTELNPLPQFSDLSCRKVNFKWPRTRLLNFSDSWHSRIGIATTLPILMLLLTATCRIFRSGIIKSDNPRSSKYCATGFKFWQLPEQT